jgi:hypothetical protein
MTDNILVAGATAFALVIIGFAAALPKILSSIKRDNLDGSFAKAQQDLLMQMQATYAAQIEPLRKHVVTLEARMAEMHDLIDNQQISLTRLRSTNASFRGVLADIQTLLSSSGHPVPENLRLRIKEITEEDFQA